MKKLLSITVATVLALAAGVASADQFEGMPSVNDRDFCPDMKAWIKYYEQFGYSEAWLENWVKTYYPAQYRKFEKKCERHEGHDRDDRGDDRR
jgi:hypothetical protein